MTATDDDRPPVERTTTVVIRTSRGQWAVIAGTVLVVVFMSVQQVGARYRENVATATAGELAVPVVRLCRDDETRRQIGDARCRVASEVQRESTVVLTPRDGRGIASTALEGGHLVVTFTDGERRDLGLVVGSTGAPGATGDAGRGIVDASLDAEGQLVVSYTDGTSQTVGHVVGRDGVDGRGVDRVEARDGRLLVYYSTAPDDAVDVGPLPPGPPGRGVATLDLDLASCRVTVRYTDGTRETKDVTGCTPEDGDDGGTTTSTAAPPSPAPTTTTAAEGGLDLPLSGG